MKILIIGGGASGLAAALEAADLPGNQVTILERQARVGRKLLATGNGRCNLTNCDLSPEHFHGEDASFSRFALRRFDLEETLSFFLRLGLLTTAEPNGRIYPFSDSANSVVDVLRLAAEQCGVEILTGVEVDTAVCKGRKFVVTAADATYHADRLIIACGGAAGAKLGGSISGYRLLEGFGHRRTKLYPSLVQLRTDNKYTRSLKGIRADAAISLYRGDRILARSSGEIQFTDYGVSGPAAFEISRIAAISGGDAVLHLDLLQTHTRQQLLSILKQKVSAFPMLTAEHLLTGMLQNRLGRTVMQRCGIAFETLLQDISGKKLGEVADCIKCFSLPMAGTMGFDSAQVTAGGMETGGFDPQTMQSRLVPGLYACGEVLDVDGDCGGYNLQWAWSSGRLAGRCAGGNT